MVKVIFEDNNLLVLDKPPNLVVEPSETNKESTLVDWLKNYFSKQRYHRKDFPDRMGIVHRLDKDTSGLLIVAKTQNAFDNLQRQFQERKTKKEYLVLVHGWVEGSGRVEGAIGRNPYKREKFAVLLDGKKATTEYKPEEKLKIKNYKLQMIFADFNKIQMRKLERMGYGKFSLLSCYPLTGRTHQIRVHLKYIQHPIVSDEKYVGHKMYRLDKRWCPRMFLHAKRLGFYHPESGKWVEFESPLPDDLEKALSHLTDNRS